MKLDKKLHIGVAYGLTLGLSYMISWLWGMVIVTILIIAKEVHDKYLKQTAFSISDMYAGISGVILGVISFSLLRAIGL